MARVSERLVKLVMPLWYLSLVVLVWSESRRISNGWIAAFLTLLVATTPLFLDHATLANADLAFTVLLFVAAIALTRWITGEAQTAQWRTLGGAVVALAMAAWFKLDGLYLGLAFLLAGGIVRSIHLLRKEQTPSIGTQDAKARKKDSRRISASPPSSWPAVRTAWLHTLASMLALIAFYAPWWLLIQSANIPSEVPSTAMLSVTGQANLTRGLSIIIFEMLFSHNNSTWSLLGAGYHLLWLVCGGAILLGWRGLWPGSRWVAPLLFLVILTLGTILFYALIYAMRPFFSIERYLMHAVPLVVLAAAYAWRARVASTQEPQAVVNTRSVRLRREVAAR